MTQLDKHTAEKALQQINDLEKTLTRLVIRNPAYESNLAAAVVCHLMAIRQLVGNLDYWDKLPAFKKDDRIEH